MRGKHLAPDVDLTTPPNKPRLYRADIEKTVNEAAILAARGNKAPSTWKSSKKPWSALLRAGAPQPLISEQEKRVIAYHEAGHTLVQMICPIPTRCTRFRLWRAAWPALYYTLPADDVPLLGTSYATKCRHVGGPGRRDVFWRM